MKLWIFLFLVLPLWATEEVVKNGAKPQGAWELQLEEELRFGPDKDDDAYFWAGAGATLQIRENGNILLIDPDAFRILEFDTKGAFVRQIGRKGEGPGEFVKLTSFDLLADGSMIVFQNVQGLTYLDYFDQNLKFVRRQTNQPIKVFLQSVDYSPDGTKIGSLYMRPDSDGQSVWVCTGILSSEQDEQIVLSKQKQSSFNQSRAGESSYWAEFLAEWFKLGVNGLGIIAFDRDHAYTSVSKTYAIDVWDKEMKKVRRIERTYKPRFQNEEAIEALIEPIREQLLSSLPPDFAAVVNEGVVRKAVELAEFPPAKPPIFGLIPMDGNGLLVIHEYDALSGKASADIFDQKGVFRGTTALPNIAVNLFSALTGGSTKILFKGDKVYALEKDDSGDFFAVRYNFKLKK